MDVERLNRRYDRLWRKAERLVEAFLNDHLADLKAAAARSRHRKPAADATGSREDNAAEKTLAVPVREVYIAVQCLKRIHEGRLATLRGGADDLQSIGSNEHTKAIAEEISRRIRALSECGNSSGDGEDSV